MKRKPKSSNSAGSPEVVGTGLVALDAILSADPNVPVRYWAGGTCGNVLIALRYLGWAAKPVARLSLEEATDTLLADLRMWKVSEDFIRVEADGSTPVIVERISVDAHGHPKHSFSWRCLGCGGRYPGYKPELLTVAELIAPKLKKTKVFFFDRVSAGALILARAAAAAGALVVFEPCSIGNPVQFRHAWEVAHVVKYSHERLSEFPEMEVESNPRLIIETLGESGLRYQRRAPGERPGKWIDVKALEIDGLKDSAGAGDWCTAGLLSKVATNGLAGFAKLTDQHLAEAMDYAQAVASWSCRFEGARGGMYAVTKPQFRKQVDEIRAGTAKLTSIDRTLKQDSAAAASFCKLCELETGVKRKTAGRKTSGTR